MRFALPLLFLVCLCSCQVQSHLAEVYGTDGKLKKREWDVNGQVAGVSSQKGADGSQNDFDGQASWNDTMTGATGIVASKEAGKVGIAKERTTRHGQTIDAVEKADARPATTITNVAADGTSTTSVVQPATSALSLLKKGKK